MQKHLNKIFLILSVVFLVFSCAAFIFLHGLIKNNQKTSQEILIEWQKESVRRDDIRLMGRSLKAIEKDRIDLDTHFAQSSNVVPFLDTLETLAMAVKAKSEVTSVDISKDKQQLVVGLRAFGSFEVLYKLMLLLENSPYELEFLSLDLQRESGGDISEDGASSPEWSASFKIKLLSFLL